MNEPHGGNRVENLVRSLKLHTIPVPDALYEEKTMRSLSEKMGWMVMKEEKIEEQVHVTFGIPSID